MSSAPLPGYFSTLNGQRARIGPVFRAAILANLAGCSPVAAQSSQTCEFALAGWVATELELQDARSAHQACRRAQRTACTAEQGRVQTLEQRLRLLRNYLDNYCRR